ncbi:helix-turn-helix domain-containing protein [Streptococcus phage 5093]|uniref:Cro repressor n=2 Tax=Aliceevansviridae TaxID=3044455 RepID=C5IUM0_9CAUD|nr:helix-turn-helix domain-containing protein [Streptococcus phage 5093]ACR45940.1 cro repressor [Streptococcus phage 5093]
MKVDLLRVRAERVAKGYTQAKMAELMGLARDQYNKRENGKISFTADELITLANLLGYSKDEIGIFFKQIVPETQQ